MVQGVQILWKNSLRLEEKRDHLSLEVTLEIHQDFPQTREVPIQASMIASVLI